MSLFKTIQLLENGANGSRRRGAGRCRSCGRSIFWCATATGKPIPFDEAPDVLESDGRLETVSTEHVHWSTCPDSDKFRKTAPTAAKHRADIDD